jgi:phospholipid/cholesterol/gamma-HCH transport system substrate-binding protein
VRIRSTCAKDAKWLRTSSVFTLVRGLVGGTQLRAYTGVLTDPPLPDGAERPVLRGDANEEIPRVIGAAKDVLDNLNQITAQDSELRKAMANLQASPRSCKAAGRAARHLRQRGGCAQAGARLERANAAGAHRKLSGNADRLIVQRRHAGVRPDGVVATMRAPPCGSCNGLLADARGSLQKVDAVLKEAQGIGGNVRGRPTTWAACAARSRPTCARSRT